MNGDDVGVVERGDGFGLALESFASLGIAGDAAGQHLQGDAAIEPRVFGEVHLAHSASAERAHNRVVAEGPADHDGWKYSLPERPRLGFTFFNKPLQAVEGLVPLRRNACQTSLRRAQRLRLELPDALPAGAMAAHETCAGEHVQMLGDRLPRDAGAGGETHD